MLSDDCLPSAIIACRLLLVVVVAVVVIVVADVLCAN